MGEAAPLGLFALAAGTFTLGTILAGWFPIATVLFATAPLFVVGGLAQFIAGMWSFRKGDTFFATAFGSFGAFNTAYALYLWLAQSRLIVGPGYGLGVVGVFVACFSLIAAMRRNMSLVAVLLFLALAYGLIAASDIAAGAPNLRSFGGWGAILASVCAFYTAGAMVVNSTSQAVVLPLGNPLMRESRDDGRAPAVVAP